MNPGTEIALLLITQGLNLYLFIVWLRFLLQAQSADFYNPVSQFTVKATAFLVDPLDRLFGGGRQNRGNVVDLRRRAKASRWNFGALLGILLIKLLQLSLIGLLIYGAQPGPVLLLFNAVFELLIMAVTFYYWLILISVVLSWIAPHSPAGDIVYLLAEPILAPCRRLLPAMGGFDLSPIIGFLALKIVEILLNWSQGQLAQLLFGV